MPAPSVQSGSARPSFPRRLCFGGSFNPIHHGHLLCARAVAETAGFDRVVLIPSAQPPHKPAGPDTMASADDRLAMCRLAADQDPLFEVSDIELRRAGPSYTIDTARELRRSGWSAVPWLIGSDNVPQLPTWHEPAALLAEIQFVVMQRPGSLLDWTTVAPAWQVLKARVVVAPLIEISASDIRRRIYDGKSVRYLTPASVTDYMIHRRLYI